MRACVCVAWQVVIVTGPTAVGKTAVGLELAKRLGGEVISADSVQVYRGLDVGSDKVGTGGCWQGGGHVHVPACACQNSGWLHDARRLVVLQLRVEQREGIPHHLIDVRDVTQDFSAGDFYDLARPVTQDILQVEACCA